jgi:hypothetical protein
MLQKQYIFQRKPNQRKVISMDYENSENSEDSSISNKKSPDVLSFQRFYREIHDEEIENAIDYLASSISENVLKEAFGLFQRDVELVSRKHFSLGMDVRNLLRRGGFDWGDMELDENWIYLLWKASKKVCEKKD